MSFLLLVSGWVFGGDVRALGDPDYHVRRAADARLSAAGWLAYPAVAAGATADDPEVAERCAVIADRLDGWVRRWVEVDGVARGVVPVPRWAGDGFLKAVCRRVDELGGWWQPTCWQYVSGQPYYQDGTRHGELGYVVRRAAWKRAVPAVVGPAAVLDR